MLKLILIQTNFLILEFFSLHGIPGCAAQTGGEEVGKTGGNFHGELSSELFIMSFDVKTQVLTQQYICLGYSMCPSSDWSREWELFSFLSLQTINIDNLSQEKDKTQSGTLHMDQVAEIFRVYEVHHRPSVLYCMCDCYFCLMYC